MSKGLTITDKDYARWLEELCKRYRRSQIKAAVKVNQEMLRFYWELGRDIVEMKVEQRWGEKVITTLSADLKQAIPGATGFSRINLYYTKRFYSLYSKFISVVPQPGEQLSSNSGIEIVPQPGEQLPAQVAERLASELFMLPWGHHKLLIDKFSADSDKALFYLHQAVENGWSRSVLLNMLGTSLYERQGKALTNFTRTLPPETSDLAQQLTRDPYCFDFLTLREQFDERELENALIDNVTKFLLELGTGFSFMGRQFHLEVGKQEFFPDLLFYNTRLHAYCVVELKTTSFKPEYLGQLSFYVSAINHQFKTDIDNPTIGLLVCKDKDNIVAQYALESYTQPIGVSEFQLADIYPTDFRSSMPTIEEIEARLGEMTNQQMNEPS